MLKILGKYFNDMSKIGKEEGYKGEVLQMNYLWKLLADHNIVRYLTYESTWGPREAGNEGEKR